MPNRDTRISRLVYNMLPDRGTRYDLKEVSHCAHGRTAGRGGASLCSRVRQRAPQALGPYYWFSAVCPNGRYALALQYPIHRALVVKIMELANAEVRPRNSDLDAMLGGACGGACVTHEQGTVCLLCCAVFRKH